MSPKPRVFTIPPGCAFLPTLVDSLLSGAILPDYPADPSAIADLTIYLPTQRAARALAALLADRGGARAQLLPRIVPLGEADEAEFELTADAAFAGADVLAPPIAPLERRLILTSLVQHWSATIDRARLKLAPDVPFLVPSSPADAVGLAGDLEALMDSFTTEGIDWSKLHAAVDADFSEYFKITTEFVRIAAENWPAIVAERQASDPIRRRTALIEAEAARLLRDRPAAPVIAAGSTGSVPATARLLAAIAHLENGAVVLPGLDTDLDGASWTTIGDHAEGSDPVHGHPQAMLRRLLETYLRIAREDVRVLGTPTPEASARQRLLSEALRPADTTHLWSAMPTEEREALARHGAQGLALVEAADEREEALAIAVALRETLENPDHTAAFITPDRALAGRVAAELARWGIHVEDSAGVSLAETACGLLARLAADAAALDFQAARLLALLAHPLVTLGWRRAQVERAAAVLEIGVLRGPAPAQGLDGLREALAARRNDTSRRRPRPERRIAEADWDLVADLLDRLALAFDGFTADEFSEGAPDLTRMTARHRQAVEALMALPDDESAPADDGSVEALAALFDDLALPAGPIGASRSSAFSKPAFSQRTGLSSAGSMRVSGRRGRKRMPS
jgi:ATP-dependent helicase/nuclease subunit B